MKMIPEISKKFAEILKLMGFEDVKEYQGYVTYGTPDGVTHDLDARQIAAVIALRGNETIGGNLEVFCVEYRKIAADGKLLDSGVGGGAFSDRRGAMMHARAMALEAQDDFVDDDKGSREDAPIICNRDGFTVKLDNGTSAEYLVRRMYFTR